MKTLKKLLSRKFLTSAAVVAAGIGTTLSESATPEVRIAGLIVAAVSTLIYNVIEGRIDAKSVMAAAGTTLNSIVDTLEDSEQED